MTDEKQFAVRSSDGSKLYSVSFLRDGAGVRVRCDCKAGAIGQMCRHKEGLIKGDAGILANPSETSNLVEIVKWIARSDLGTLLNAIRETEEAAKGTQARLKELRQQLTRIVR